MFKEILLPIDLANPDTQSKALATALGHVEAFGSHLHILAILPDMGVGVVSSFFPADYGERALQAMNEQMAHYVGQNIPAGVSVTSHIANGTIYEEILTYAQSNGVDLIVMASHRPELSDFLIGPNAAKVVRHAKCSVLVVRETA